MLRRTERRSKVSTFDPNNIPRLVSDGVLLDECRADLAAAQAEVVARSNHYEQRLREVALAHLAEVAELRRELEQANAGKGTLRNHPDLLTPAQELIAEQQSHDRTSKMLHTRIAAAESRACTPAERAVLACMADIPLCVLEECISEWPEAFPPKVAFRFELARRATREQPAGECDAHHAFECKQCKPAPVSGAKEPSDAADE